MVILYLLMGGWVILVNITQIPYVLQTIIFSAFDFKTIYVGGFWGLVLLGIRRLFFQMKVVLVMHPCTMDSLRQRANK